MYIVLSLLLHYFKMNGVLYTTMLPVDNNNKLNKCMHSRHNIVLFLFYNIHSLPFSIHSDLYTSYINNFILITNSRALLAPPLSCKFCNSFLFSLILLHFFFSRSLLFASKKSFRIELYIKVLPLKIFVRKYSSKSVSLETFA